MLPCAVLCRVTGDVQALRIALTNMYDDMKPIAAGGNDWVKQLDDLTNALTYAVGTENPFASELLLGPT